MEGYGHALSRMMARWNPEEMDALLLVASLVNAIGYEGPGDFLLDADGRLSRVPEQRLSPLIRHGPPRGRAGVRAGRGRATSVISRCREPVRERERSPPH